MWRNDKNSQPLLQDFDKHRYFLRMDLIQLIPNFNGMQINQNSKFFLRSEWKKMENWNEIEHDLYL